MNHKLLLENVNKNNELNDLINTMCCTINKFEVNSANQYSEIYKQIFKQAKKLNLLNEYENEYQCMLQHIKNMLNEDFKSETLKYFAENNIIKNYYAKYNIKNGQIQDIFNLLINDKTLSKMNILIFYIMFSQQLRI